MRHFLPTILLLLISAISTYAQQADSSHSVLTEPSTAISPDLYKQTKEWKYCKVLRAVGWTSLGIGVPTTLFGLYVTCMQSLDGGDSSLGVTALITGGVLTISSIPLLITSNYYKRKAKRIEMSLSAMEMPKYIDKSGYVPALKLSINF